MEDSKIARFIFKRKPYLLLKALRSKDGIYSAQLAKQIDCSYAYIVRLINQMEKLGLVYIERTKNVNYIKLTKKGRQLIDLISNIEDL
jgi:DNA-binding MarR family transcriptional regulator